MSTKLQVSKNSFKLFQKDFLLLMCWPLRIFYSVGLRRMCISKIFLVMGIQSGTECCIFACR